MKDNIVLITGATDGIGRQTALELAQMGAVIILHGRNHERGSAVVEEIKKSTGNEKIDLFIADLSSQKQIHQFCSQVKSKYDYINVLINNAGTYMKERTVSEDNIEMTFAVNHLAPFLITYLLLNLLQKGVPSRIINVSSVAHQRGKIEWDNLQGEKSYDPYNAYALSKLANVLFTNELADRLSGTGITANSLHPGVINTKLLKAGFNITGAGLHEGASTSIYLASSDEVQNISGKYFVKSKESSTLQITSDKKLRKDFWTYSEKLTGIKY